MTTQKTTDYETKKIVFRGQSVSIRQLMIIGWTTADVDAINALAEYGLATGDMCILLSVYRMRKMSVKSDASPLPLDINKDIQLVEKRFKYIHPMVEDERAWQIHFEVKPAYDESGQEGLPLSQKTENRNLVQLFPKPQSVRYKQSSDNIPLAY